MTKLNTVENIKRYIKLEITRLRKIDSPESVASDATLCKLLNEIEKAEK